MLEDARDEKRHREMNRPVYTAKLIQGGLVVAEVYAPTLLEAQREIMHYAMMYAKDGSVIVKLPPAPKRPRPS